MLVETKITKLLILVAMWFATLPVLFAKVKDVTVSKSEAPVLLWLKKTTAPRTTTVAIRVEHFTIDKDNKVVNITLNKIVRNLNFRPGLIKEIEDSLTTHLPPKYKNFKARAFVSGKHLSYYIPNLYREDGNIDSTKCAPSGLREDTALISYISRPYTHKFGLRDRHIALWASHGYYFDNEVGEWLMQRPRLFEISEDSYTLSIVNPFLVPMLERAGATVFMPRERDFQTNEIIVDNDGGTANGYSEHSIRRQRWHKPTIEKNGDTIGYSNQKQVYRNGDNPFKTGTYRKIRSKCDGQSYAEWTPNFKESGEYAVYVSYKSVENSSSAARYIVYHTGGKSEFDVDQRRGGGTWIYLGTFKFDYGKSSERGCVRLLNKSEESGKNITADAVRFGGGMGKVERCAMEVPGTEAQQLFVTSGKPQYLEAARYWLQMAGFSDSVYANNESEYKSDYMSRALWVNALSGGSRTNPGQKGLKVPIDLSLALHTDAGIDSVSIGTLAICMTTSDGKTKYPIGSSRTSSRDLSEIVEQEIVDCIRARFCPDWTCRGVRDESYYEARVPNVPTTLIELLSHQNFEDMKYAHDPVFKFEVARSIYKGVAKFMSSYYDYPCVIAPLPPDHLSAILDITENVKLSWKPVTDIGEETAVPTGYIVYTAKEEGGFDNGIYVRGTDTILPISRDTIYRFKVTAVNEGGESMDSEEMSACRLSASSPHILVVNAFNRVSPPSFYNDSLFGGFLDDEDPGVPYKTDYSRTGRQTNFDKTTKFDNNDYPGFGSSGRETEGKPLVGNTFNYTSLHGKSLRRCGMSYSSMSDEVFDNSVDISVTDYAMIDYILGLEKRTIVGLDVRYNVMGRRTRNVLSSYLDQGGKLFVSGAYLGSEMYATNFYDRRCTEFAMDHLHFMLERPFCMEARQIRANLMSRDFSHEYTVANGTGDSTIYDMPAPDAIIPTNNGEILMRFVENGLPCMVGYSGIYSTVVSTVPFETVVGDDEKYTLMDEILSYMKVNTSVAVTKPVDLGTKAKVKKSYKKK